MSRSFGDVLIQTPFLNVLNQRTNRKSKMRDKNELER